MTTKRNYFDGFASSITVLQKLRPYRMKLNKKRVHVTQTYEKKKKIDEQIPRSFRNLCFSFVSDDSSGNREESK